MTSLAIKDFTTLVNDQVTAIQGQNAKLVDLQVGSILRAVVEANAGVSLWQENNILLLYSAIRASTSSGADLDSWMADFNFFRLPAVSASGAATFSRFTATQTATIPVGDVVQTADGSQQFSVVADSTNAAFNAALNAYVLPTGTASVSVPVTALVAGTGANVSAGQINSLFQPIPYVDSVSNALAFTNGEPAESDQAFRARFVLYIGSLSKGTLTAVESAVDDVQTGLFYDVVENFDTEGNSKPGFFYVVVDDGSGSPPTSLINNVWTAVNAVRPLTSTFTVVGPTRLGVNIVMSAVIASGYDAAATKALIVSVLTGYLALLNVGSSLPYTRIAQVAYDASPGVVEIVAGYTVNGGTADLVATGTTAIRPGTITVN